MLNFGFCSIIEVSKLESWFSMAITHKKQDDLEKMLENFAILPTATKPSSPNSEKEKINEKIDKK